MRPILIVTMGITLLVRIMVSAAAVSSAVITIDVKASSFAILDNVVKLGMKVSDLTQKLGEADEIKTNSYGRTFVYEKTGILIDVEGDVVRNVHFLLTPHDDFFGVGDRNIKAARARTKENIAVGATRDEIVKAYGEPESTLDLSVLDGGLQLNYNGFKLRLMDGRLVSITIHTRPAKAK